MPRGGKRAGAGRPPGTTNPATRDKAMAREALRAIVDREMDAMVSAQIANAKGIKYLVARGKDGKFTRIGEAELEAILAGEDSERVTIEMWEKDPSVQAFTDLMNRHMDKPIEPVELTGANKGPLEVAAILQSARKRLARRD